MEEIINEITEEEVFEPVVVDEPIQYNKIYARTNDNGDVVHVFSEAFDTPLSTDICIDSTNIERHGAQKYRIVDEDGYYNYKLVDGQLVERDKTEDIKRNYNLNRIAELKSLLGKWDYINSKFIEAFVNQDNVRLEELKIEYNEILSKRQEWRDEINALEIESKS